MKHFFSFFCIAVTCMVLLAACARPNKPDGFPKTVSCVITITQEGQPLALASVQLTPADGQRDWMCRAMTDEQGVATMHTYGRYEGAPLGKFKVVVSKIESDQSKFTVPDETDTAAMEAYYRNIATENLKDYTVIEPQYTTPETTPLDMEITGKTTLSFDVGKKIRKVL